MIKLLVIFATCIQVNLLAEIDNNNCNNGAIFITECGFNITFNNILNKNLHCILKFTLSNPTVKFSNNWIKVKSEEDNKCPSIEFIINYFVNGKAEYIRLSKTCGGEIVKLERIISNFSSLVIKFYPKGLDDQDSMVNSRLELSGKSLEECKNKLKTECQRIANKSSDLQADQINQSWEKRFEEYRKTEMKLKAQNSQFIIENANLNREIDKIKNKLSSELQMKNEILTELENRYFIEFRNNNLQMVSSMKEILETQRRYNPLWIAAIIIYTILLSAILIILLLLYKKNEARKFTVPVTETRKHRSDETNREGKSTSENNINKQNTDKLEEEKLLNLNPINQQNTDKLEDEEQVRKRIIEK